MDKQTKRNLIFFPIGTIGRDMTYQLVSAFLLTYIMFTRQLTTAQLGAVTAIMVFTRIFDGVNDPIMGNIIESTRTKWGKFKPWLLAGGVSTALVVTVAFSSNLQGWPFIIFFGIEYLLYSITFTMSDISFWAMIPALSSDANERNMFTSRATFCAGIGGTLALVLIPIFTTGEHAIGGSANTAFKIVAIVVSILTPLLLLFTLLGAKERREDQNTKPDKISLAHVVSTIKNNDQLVWMIVCFLLQGTGNAIVLGGIGSTFIYFEFGYSGSNYSIFTTIGMAATAVLMAVYPTIAKKSKRKELMGRMMIVSTIGYLMMFFAGIILPTNNLKFWLIVIGYMLGNYGNYSYYLIMMISIMNTVEYNEYKFGQRQEAIITSLRPFLTKLSSAIVVGLTSAVYMIFGVTNYTNKISEFENAASTGAIDEAGKAAGISEVLSKVTSTETNGMLVFISLVPLVMMFLAYVVYKKKYMLDEEEYDRICAELEKRKEA